MKLYLLFKTSISGLTTHKLRSLLTILGIVIGVAAIIVIMSLGQGAKNLILGKLQSFGSKSIGIVPGREPSGPTDILSTFTDSLKEKDLESLSNKNNVPYATRIMTFVFGNQTLAYENETYNTTVLGTTELFAERYNVYPAQGRIFNEEEIKGYADVVVIGKKVKEELFGASDAIGQKIKIKNRNFRVVGVLNEAGQVLFINFDKVAVVPYTTAQRYIFGIKHFNRILVEVSSEEKIPETIKDIETTLRTNHNITDPKKDDFFLETQASAIETIGAITTALTLFLTSVAAISLIVGGIGIMNIMLVSVTERTREIGLRKALGATSKNILSQFLLEAVLLTGTGGAIGIILGALFSFIATLVLTKFYGLDWSFTFPLNAIFLGLAVSSGIGLIFGIYPAKQAARKEPIEALRYE